ncbi:uncharacterized protein [Marmota flaviventris]|uniref:uncharacterized protein n=1 Tax=Marmota flaviventris TaxID=93162 RepID=UPI003A8372E1
MGFDAAIKRNEIMALSGKWMELVNIMLSEENHSEIKGSPGGSGGGGGGGGGGGERGAGIRPEAQLQRGARGPPGPLEWADAELGAEAPRAAEAKGAPGPGARGREAGGRLAEREPYACMDPGAALQRRAGGGGGGGGLGADFAVLTGGQARRRKQPPRPADFKLQVIIIGSRGVGKTSLMERFTDDTFCEACKSTVGVDFKIKTVELRGKKIRLQIWLPSALTVCPPSVCVCFHLR